MAQDYASYKNSPNVTFIGINMSRTGDARSVKAQVDRYDLKPFANMVDAGGATSSAYGVPKNAANWLVIVDPEGKIAYNASKGWTWSSGADRGRAIHQTVIERSLKGANGLLGVKEIPSSMEYAAHLFDLQQFSLLEVELLKAEAKAGDTEAQGFAKKLRERVAEERKRRMTQIQGLVATDPVQAYREAIAFVEAFPKAPEMAELRKLGMELNRKPEVQLELKAEDGYRQVLVPAMRQCRDMRTFTSKVKPLLDGYLQTFGKAQFAEVVKAAVDEHGLAVSKVR
ncbi:MAG: hypothetical protein HS116_26950 [Planctomycetes bacterium]|nr:hypothetical protein [Planctomycetota bacterium]